MVADPDRYQTTTDAKPSRSGTWRRKDLPAPQVRKEDCPRTMKPEGADFLSPGGDRTTLLEYAAFVLDQEARYCQQ